jgi:glycosyltransferase involved in cell wall biosynthesis
MLLGSADEEDLSPLRGNRMPRVCLVLDLEAKKRGSLEEQLIALGHRLTASRIAATYFFSSDPPIWMLKDFADCGVELQCINFRRAAEAVATVSRWFYAMRPDLVHFHFVRAYSPMIAAARAVGARVVVHDHMALGHAFVDVAQRGRAAHSAIQSIKRARAAVLNRLVDRRIAVSNFVADTVAATEFVQRDRIAVLEHGIDLGRYAAASPTALREEVAAGDRPIIACVSRMAPEKGVDCLIRAHAELDRDAILVIAGDGRDADRCKELAAELHIDDRVRFLGLRRDVPQIFAGCDIAVVPSQAPEAFGLTVVEAMAAGKAVVVTDAGAMPEIVDHGRCGTVVPKGDYHALADAVRHLIDGPTFARMLGDAGRQRAHEHYGLDTWVDRMTDLYAATAPSLIFDTSFREEAA